MITSAIKKQTSDCCSIRGANHCEKSRRYFWKSIEIKRNREKSQKSKKSIAKLEIPYRFFRVICPSALPVRSFLTKRNNNNIYIQYPM